MPSFTSQLPNLQAMGPLVDMRVWIGTPVEEALKKAGSKVPEPVAVKGMIDTGATGSVIQPAIAQQTRSPASRSRLDKYPFLCEYSLPPVCRSAHFP